MLEQDSPGGSGAGTPHRKSVNRKRKLPEAVKELATKELTQAYCVLLELLKGYKTFHNPPDIFAKNMVGYYDVVKEPMWLNEMSRKFESGEYKHVSQFAVDIRLLLENCYNFFGPKNIVTKRALKLEHAYMECVALIPKDLQSQYSLTKDGLISETAEVGEEYQSVLLEQITLQQEKEVQEHRRRVEEQLVLADENKDIVHWEREVLVPEDKQRQISGMWELPLIGQFVFLALDSLNIDEIPMYEVERMLLMPRSSSSLARLVTSLLVSPMLRKRLVHLPPMSYHMWSRRLKHRVASWYRIHVKNYLNPLKTFELTGVETEFWKILGETNPLEEHEFHELNFHQRVWVLKTLCDCCLHNQAVVYEKVGTSEMRNSYKHHLGKDRNDCCYEHLPELCGDDLRVYRQAANYRSLIERDEAYWESIAANTPQDDPAATKATTATEEDGGASDTCSNDSRDVCKAGQGERTRSAESDSGLSCNSSDTRQCDDSSTEPSRAGSSMIMSRHDYIAASPCPSPSLGADAAGRPVYDPRWLGPEGSGFQIVADSYESLNELIGRLGGDTSDQRLCNAKMYHYHIFTNKLHTPTFGMKIETFRQNHFQATKDELVILDSY